jgi:hypothetical protein
MRQLGRVAVIDAAATALEQREVAHGALRGSNRTGPQPWNSQRPATSHAADDNWTQLNSATNCVAPVSWYPRPH